MRLKKIISLAIDHAQRSRREFLLASFGIVLGCAAFVFFLSLSNGSKSWIVKLFPLDQVEVIAPSASLAGMDLTKTMNAETVEAILNQSEAPVVSAMPRSGIALPVIVSGYFNDQRLVSEFLGDGIDASFIDDPEISKLFKDWESIEEGQRNACGPAPNYRCESLYYCDARDRMCHHNVPVIVSPALLEIFNKQYAPSRGLPVIGADIQAFIRMRGGLEKMRFYFDLGDGQVVKEGQTTRRVEGTFVGVHEHAIGLGATLPIQYIQRWNKEFSGTEAAENYSSIVVTLKNKDDTAKFGAWVMNSLNLRLKDSQGEKFALIVSVVTLLFLSISLVIVLLAAINISHTFFMQVSERRAEIGLLRALGATQKDIRRMFVGEAALLGLLGGVMGSLLGLAAVFLADFAFTTKVPDFPFKPNTFFATPWWILAVTIVLAVFFSVLGGFLPARRAARMQPASALSAR